MWDESIWEYETVKKMGTDVGHKTQSFFFLLTWLQQWQWKVLCFLCPASSLLYVLHVVLPGSLTEISFRILIIYYSDIYIYTVYTMIQTRYWTWVLSEYQPQCVCTINYWKVWCTKRLYRILGCTSTLVFRSYIAWSKTGNFWNFKIFSKHWCIVFANNGQL